MTNSPLTLFNNGLDETAAGSGENGLSQQTPLNDAINAFLDSKEANGASIYTVKAFRSDLGLLAQWGGARRMIGRFGTHDLNQFLHWMLHIRERPCSSKTYARRVTTLKSFFGWLHHVQALPRDPANAVIQRTPVSAMPEALTAEEVKKLLYAADTIRVGKPDARPQVLILLLLETGIKKGESMALVPSDVVISKDDKARLWIRYTNPEMRYKERRIAVSSEWLAIFNEYMAQRNPPAGIFDCTARNLEYILRDVATMAGVPSDRLSFESLRWTCALRDYRAKMDAEDQRRKLGLSRVTWAKTLEKLEKLAKDSDL